MNFFELMKGLYRASPGLVTALLVAAFLIGILYGYQVIGPHMLHRP
ncbi:MAG TPA: hypothetical protein VFW98_06335 [Gemmatimonadaceae bacterium]|nr:hypothetical protein [Gemmatimonadaceae bacterium]